MEKYLGEQIPKLGFGLMRLPMLGTDKKDGGSVSGKGFLLF